MVAASFGIAEVLGGVVDFMIFLAEDEATIFVVFVVGFAILGLGKIARFFFHGGILHLLEFLLQIVFYIIRT